MHRALGVLVSLSFTGLSLASGGPNGYVGAVEPPTPQEDQFFGGEVAVDGDVLVVGAAGEDISGDENVGAAYVYRFDGAAWSFEQRIAASDGEPEDEFGSDVAIDDGVIVVGARDAFGQLPNRGIAYVFRYDGSAWVEEAILDTMDNSTRSFGSAVDVSGDVVVIGANRSSVGGFGGVGRVHVYRYDGSSWAPDATLTPRFVMDNLNYGESVAIDGDAIAVGAPGSLGGTTTGYTEVWRFDGSDWQTEDTVAASDPIGGDEFGASVSLDGDRLLAGAPRAFTASPLGVAYAFLYDASAQEWTQTDRFPSPAGLSADSGYASATALDGSTALVSGASDAQSPVRALRGRDYALEQDLTEPGDPLGSTRFGFDVDASGPWIVVGAFGATVDGQSLAGRAYVFCRDVVRRPDLDGNGDVGPLDLAMLINAWGPCP